jgi:hypothetical protein
MMEKRSGQGAASFLFSKNRQHCLLPDRRVARCAGSGMLK